MKVVDNGTQASGNLFTDGNPGSGLLGTIVDSSWLNSIQEELKNIVLDSDSGISELSQDNSELNQVVTAIRAIIDVKIAASGGGGGGGDATGTLKKSSESKLSSDASTTSTSLVQAHSISYTPIANANHRYVDFIVDASIADAAAFQADGDIELQVNNTGSWAAIHSFKNSFKAPAGKTLVKTTRETLGSSSSNSNSSNTTTGLQLDYTAIAGANTRKVKVYLDSDISDSNGGGCYAAYVLQYFNGSWIDLKELSHGILSGGAGQINSRTPLSCEVEHAVTDATPQYRIVSRISQSPDSGDAVELKAGSYIEIDEYAQQQVTEKRDAFTYIYKDTTSYATPQYRIMHKVASGDTSIIKAGSLIRVREYN